MMDWSEQQQSIFDWFSEGSGNLAVRARAGTGKTTTILEGINRAPESSILLAAFNKSIAVELQSRVGNRRAEVKTLHALGFKFIRSNWDKIRVETKGERAKQLAQEAAPGAPGPIITVIKKLHTKAREITPFADCPEQLMELAVRFNCLPEEDWEADGWGAWRVCEVALSAMVLAKARTAYIDFADMLFLPLVHHWVRPWFELVVVDEAQDMTPAQLQLAKSACKKRGRMAVVGDDRQAIYGFRGAASDSLDRLKKELRASELGLTTTYRCPRKVVDLAARIVPDYRAAPSAPEGKIDTVSYDAMVESAQEGDFVLSRTNAPLVGVCMALLKRGTRARIKGRAIGVGILALIKRLKIQSIQELPAKLVAWEQREIARAMKLGAASETRIAFVQDQVDLLNALAAGADSVAELEMRLGELFADDAEDRAVMCSTVHRAKGLEAERVFLLEGTFRDDHIEEDNIRYVAITRAKQTLFWVQQ